MSFIWFGFYTDIPIPFSNKVIMFDTGWHRLKNDPDPTWFSIWSFGWRYKG